MNILCIADSAEEEFWGPYTDQNLADRVLKIVRMAVDEGAEIVSRETDQYKDEILAGLLPFKIVADLEDGQVVHTEVCLCWPPAEWEGLVSGKAERGDDEPGQVDYFFWAATKGDAIKRLGQLDEEGKLKKEG